MTSPNNQEVPRQFFRNPAAEEFNRHENSLPPSRHGDYLHQSPPPASVLPSRPRMLIHHAPRAPIFALQPRFFRPQWSEPVPRFPAIQYPERRMLEYRVNNSPSSHAGQLVPIEYVHQDRCLPVLQKSLQLVPPGTQYPIKRILHTLEQSKAQLQQQIAPLENLVQDNLQTVHKRLSLANDQIPDRIRHIGSRIKRKLVGDVKKNHVKRNGFIGLSLFVLSSFMLFNQNWMIRSGINGGIDMALSSESRLVEYALENLPTFTNIWAPEVCAYLFGIRNGQAFLKNGAKPHLNEVGPFCFRIHPRIKITQWKKDRIKLKINLHFKYDEADSLSLDTRYNSLNLPIFLVLLIVQNAMRHLYIGFLGPAVYNVAYLAMRATGEKLIEEDIPASTYLIGRKIPIIAIADRILFRPMRALGVPIPEPLGIFGIYLSSDFEIGVEITFRLSWLGPIEIYIREEDGHAAGEFASLLGSSEYFFARKDCMKPDGSVGLFLKRPVAEDTLRLNLPLVCRQIDFTKEYSHLMSGAWLTRYKMDEQMFNYSIKHNRDCYCNKKTKKECDGWHDASPCLVWAPLGFTLPHFYRSPTPLSRVRGLTPKKENHSFYLDMDTNLGLPLNAQIGIQLIADVNPIWGVPALNSLPKFQFPVFWVHIKYGLVGWFAPVAFAISNGAKYGNLLWLVSGFPLSGLFFYKAYRQRKYQKLIRAHERR